MLFKTKLCTLILCFIAFSLSAQKIRGTISIDKEKAPFIVISNITNGLQSETDQEGYFEIKASVSDSISISSIFYDPLILVLKDTDFEGSLTLELTEKINQLDKIVLRESKFEEEKFNQNLKNIIAYDKDKNMHNYETPSNGMIDFMKIGKRIVKLVKPKKKTSPHEKFASYSDLSKLLKDQSVKDLLNIEEQDIPLFTEFCTGKIKNELLAERNKFLLLDVLFNLHSDFKKLRARDL